MSYAFFNNTWAWTLHKESVWFGPWISLVCALNWFGLGTGSVWFGHWISLVWALKKDSIKICLQCEALKIILEKWFCFLTGLISVEKHLSQEFCFINSLLLHQMKKKIILFCSIFANTVISACDLSCFCTVASQRNRLECFGWCLSLALPWPIFQLTPS